MGINWCVFAIQRLKDYNNKKEAIENLQAQIEEKNERFTAIRSATTDSTPVHGGDSNKREEMLISNIAARQELQRNLDIIKQEVAITEKGLAVLTPAERNILQRFYVSRQKGYIDRLCEELYISQTELYRRKDDALKKFTCAIYGIVEL